MIARHEGDRPALVAALQAVGDCAAEAELWADGYRSALIARVVPLVNKAAAARDLHLACVALFACLNVSTARRPRSRLV